MYSTICFTSSRGNHYLYDFIKKEFMPCHPLIHLYNQLDRENRLDTFPSTTNEAKAFLTNIYNQSTIEYYKKKYLSLKARNYFSRLQKEPFTQYNSQDIKEVLSNVGSIVFEITNACNLKCAYCINGCLYNSQTTTENNYLSFDTVKSSIDYLYPLWSSELNKSSHQEIIVGFYGGEPLLNFSLIKKSVEYCNSLKLRNRSFKFNMTTNATLLDKHIDYLVKNNFRLTISLDGDQLGQSYRTFHNGRNSFDRVYFILKDIQKEYPEFWKENISFNSVLHNRNSVEGTHQFIYEEFGIVPEIHSINNSGVLPEKMDEFNKIFVSYYNSVNQSKENIRKERFTSDPYYFSLCQFLLWHGDNQFFNYESFLYSNNSYVRAHTGTCFPFSRKIYITADQKILVCERISHQYALGEIKNGELILNLEKIADTYNHYYDKLYEQCKDCYMINGCHQCIFQLDDLNSDQPICHMRHTEEDIANYLRLHIDLLESREINFEKIFNESILS